MRPLKKFNEFLESEILRKKKADKERGKSLKKEAERKEKSLKEFLEKIGLKEENANDVIENCYDIIIFLIRSKLYVDGYAASGYNAHEAEISYLSKLNFLEEDIRFMNELRYFRNGILYYGKSLNKEYAKKVVDFLKKMLPKLKKLI